ncbi:hypothetical protein C8Q74DRAFT_1313806 [Fomes fomentarius]|nr:hypothetical protein C8Q74DRAFT_1313806 [Fomes fomentarius]
MGVHGLTTYLRETKHILSRSVQLTQLHPNSGSQPQQRIPLVVDAWSFIYEVVLSAELPWVYGGEYARFAGLVEQVVRAWIEVGLELHFVFDGPYPALKFPTLVSRITENTIRAGLLFFRTSAQGRAAPRFLRETAMLPPLAYSVCVDTLVGLAAELSSPSSDARPAVGEDVERDSSWKEGGGGKGPLYVHFADEEGDPYAVALAGRLGAYVAGRDSDFVVLNAEGYKGYVPLDEMLWTLTLPSLFPSPSARATSLGQWDEESSVYSASVAGDDDEDGFQTVRKGKGRGKRKAGRQAGADQLPHQSQNVKAGKGILPPSALSDSDPAPAEGEHGQGQLALTFAVYDPSTIAAHLGIPISLLPLLGAFLGNDFTGSPASDDSAPPPATTAEIRSKGRNGNLQRLFFQRGTTHAQRIERVAGTLSGILATAFAGGARGSGGGMSAKKKGKRPIGSVMELIDAAVSALVVRPLDTFATGEREAVVERIAEATLQYAIPKAEDGNAALEDEDGEEDGGGPGGLRWVSDVCPLHVAEGCPLFASLSGLVNVRHALAVPENDKDEDEDDVRAGEGEAEVRERYVGAYRRGRLDPHILNALQTGTMWPRTFLEDPDKESVQRSVGRGVRMWTYAVLDRGVGLPVVVEAEGEEGGGEGDGDGDGEQGEERDEDEDELVDVVEEESSEDEGRVTKDPLARLRGALKQLDGSDEESGTDGELGRAQGGHAKDVVGRAKIVKEYVRRGTRLVGEEVVVSPLDELLQDAWVQGPDVKIPPQLWGRKERRRLLMRALGSDTERVAGLRDESVLGVLAVRWVVSAMDKRARESAGVKERQAERWTEREAKAVLASLTGDVPGGEDGAESRVEVVERHVQLVAQVLCALDAVEQLAQVLLVAPATTSPGRRMSGGRCHGLLCGRAAGEPSEEVWRATVDGLEDAFRRIPVKKKDKKATAPKAATSSGRRGQRSLFGLLADADP